MKIYPEVVIFLSCLPGLLMFWSSIEDDDIEKASTATGIVASALIVMLLCAALFGGRYLK